MNWRDVTDLQQLDILTARRLGWRVVNDPPLGDISAHFYARDPEGAGCGVGRTEQEAWISAWEREHIPRYTSDLNAAAGLPIPDRYELTVRKYHFDDHDGVRRISTVVWYEEHGSMKRIGTVVKIDEALARTLSWHALADEKERTK